MQSGEWQSCLVQPSSLAIRDTTAWNDRLTGIPLANIGALYIVGCGGLVHVRLRLKLHPFQFITCQVRKGISSASIVATDLIELTLVPPLKLGSGPPQ
jgi:hypothetical protein